MYPFWLDMSASDLMQFAAFVVCAVSVGAAVLSGRGLQA